jgi:alpha-L-fucosidase 2
VQQTVKILTTVLTSVTTNDAPPLAPALAANTAADPSTVHAETESFWSRFWSMSSVSLPTRPMVERFWYSAQYLMGMASREGRIAPGLWGPWVSTDTPAWCGGYTLDYNYGP